MFLEQCQCHCLCHCLDCFALRTTDVHLGSNRNVHLRTFASQTEILRSREAPSQTASLAVAGVAVAALTASGRKALNIKPQLVALSAFENELGVQAPVGFLAFQQYLLHIHIYIISDIVNVA